MLFYMPKDEQIQRQSKTNKQGREGALSPELIDEWRDRLFLQRKRTRNNYQWATENDIARELARIDLPLNTYSQWFWKIDLHNLFHALGLRCHEHASWEIRQYFNWLAGLAKRLAPVSFEAWEDYHFYARTFSRQEMWLLRSALAVEGKEVVSRLDECGNPGRIYADQITNVGLTKTERAEFLAKFEESTCQDFDIDLTVGKEPNFFEEKFREAAEG